MKRHSSSQWFRMWLKVAFGILLAINLSFGSPLSGLHNDDVVIVESKYRTVKSDESVISPLYVPTTYRLPNNSIPLHYDLFITTDVDKGIFDFTGSVKIHIQIVNESQEIILHYRQTTIDVINLLNVDGSTIVAQNLPYEQIEAYDFLVITLPNTVYPNDELVLEINYFGIHRSDGGGFYRGSYVNTDGVTVWYATTQFEIDDARHAMPCYDEPGIRAPISATLRHGRTFTAVSNTDVESITEDGEYLITKFLETPRIQTYLLAFLVSDFDYANATNTRIPQKIYARPELIRNGFGDFAATVVGPILQGLEEHIGVDYPITKMDHAALSLFNFGAMENIGLITYTENGLLFDPNTAPASRESRQMSIIRLIAHEYVHQWFGNIVSPTWWQYVWLNEGFATLFQSYISDLVYPGMNFLNNFITNDMPRAFSVDVLSQNSWAMNHYTEEPARLWDKFGGIGYQKSGCVLRMFQATLTPETFAKGLNYYQTAMYMQAATPDDLHAGLQRAYDEDYPGNTLNVNELMHSWEDRPGYPLISVSVSNNDLVFSQRRYPGSAGEIYSVPLTMATKSNAAFDRKTPTVWLHSAEGVFAQSQLNYASGDWIVLNTQQIGYYRVDYDTSLWRAIINQLTEDHTLIHAINRAVLQDEIYLSLTDSTLNRVTVTDCLNILQYFGKEDEPIAWSKANALISLLNRRLLGTSKYEDFLQYLREITSPHLSVIGYEAVDFEASVTTSLRSSTKSWNCLALDDACLTNEYNKFLEFYNTGSSASFDYCHALRNLNADTYQTIVNGVATDSSHSSRTNYLNNLGCSLNEVNLRNFLDITISTNILTAAERQNIFINTMGRSSVALGATIAFIDENYAAISTRGTRLHLKGILWTKYKNGHLKIPPDVFLDTEDQINSLNDVLKSLAPLLNSNENIAQLQALVSKLVENGISLEVSQIEALYMDGVTWHNNHFQAIIDWFGPDEETTTEVPTNQPTYTPTYPPTTQPPQTTDAPSSAPTGVILSFGMAIVCLALHL